MPFENHARHAGFQSSNHWVVCERCGADRRHNNLRKEWTGLVVCADGCWEPRNPQDFIRAARDRIGPEGFVRPVPTDKVTTITESVVGGIENDTKLDEGTNDGSL